MQLLNGRTRIQYDRLRSGTSLLDRKLRYLTMWSQVHAASPSQVDLEKSFRAVPAGAVSSELLALFQTWSHNGHGTIQLGALHRLPIGLATQPSRIKQLPRPDSDLIGGRSCYVSWMLDYANRVSRRGLRPENGVVFEVVAAPCCKSSPLTSTVGHLRFTFWFYFSNELKGHVIAPAPIVGLRTGPGSRKCHIRWKAACKSSLPLHPPVAGVQARLTTGSRTISNASMDSSGRRACQSRVPTCTCRCSGEDGPPAPTHEPRLFSGFESPCQWSRGSWSWQEAFWSIPIRPPRCWRQSISTSKLATTRYLPTPYVVFGDEGDGSTVVVKVCLW